MITYTALSPMDTVVAVVCMTLDHALDMATEDLARGWAPATLRCGRLHWDIEGIVRLVEARAARTS